jgi:hypothetical protein
MEVARWVVRVISTFSFGHIRVNLSHMNEVIDVMDAAIELTPRNQDNYSTPLGCCRKQYFREWVQYPVGRIKPYNRKKDGASSADHIYYLKQWDLERVPLYEESDRRAYNILALKAPQLYREDKQVRFGNPS